MGIVQVQPAPRERELECWDIIARRSGDRFTSRGDPATDLAYAAVFFEGRLPEAFAGYDRRATKNPVQYPTACSPQAWAAGSVFLILQACLGLEIDATRRQIRLAHAELPSWLEQVEIRDLHVAGATVAKAKIQAAS